MDLYMYVYTTTRVIHFYYKRYFFKLSITLKRPTILKRFTAVFELSVTSFSHTINLLSSSILDSFMFSKTITFLTKFDSFN